MRREVVGFVAGVLVLSVILMSVPAFAQEPVLPGTEALRDAEGDAVGTVDLTLTRRGNLIFEVVAEELDLREHRIAAVDSAAVCEAPSFDAEVVTLVNLSEVPLFPVRGIPAQGGRLTDREAEDQEFVTVLTDFDSNALFSDEDGSALVVYEGLDPEGAIIACAVLSAPNGVVPLAEVTADPEAFEGQEVTIEDEVAETFGRGGFTFGDEEVLIISTEPAGFDSNILTLGERLRITGEPALFDISEFEERFGITLNARLAQRFEGRPFIAVNPADVEPLDD
ncbi:MAG: hypothetical protein M3220_13050 [Chloroflexota bacterium]|nr:hypothetical protein [Chloroflexota bacterium]